MANVVIIGPAHPLRGGGLTTFNHRLAKEFAAAGDECTIYSFSLQYPSFLFPGKSQFSTDPPPEGIKIVSVINSVNPISWIKTGNLLRKIKPDLIVVRFWLPFMGPAFGTILRKVRKNNFTKIICLADNVVPHEKRVGDRGFTKYFLASCDGFITMSEKVLSDLRSFEPGKPVKLVAHPLYDNFGAPVGKEQARAYLQLPAQDKIILFFGFIRKYKGLDILLEAMTDERIKQQQIKLLVAGEFYDDEKKYLQQVDHLGIRDQLILRTNFIPDNDVKYYLCAADAIVQPYRNATQSGVTPLAYHFERPMIVTNVGGLPGMVTDGRSGLIATPHAGSLAENILRFYQLGEDYFIPQLREEKQKYSWTTMVNAIKELADEVKK